MFEIVLFEPEIPPNTGNIIRLCANTGSNLHLIKPLGFELTDKRCRRAGLDYHEYAEVKEYDSLDDCLSQFKTSRTFAISTRGSKYHHEVNFQDGDVVIFGPETRGLPKAFLNSLESTQIIRIPMLPTNRSLNLSNSVGIIVYEAWRQCGFNGAE
ncbi:MAG: tRNA (uridine(34)/cytosine(34)/5-carboxymethylaminomethyluridine(34)-2'-O)-methyltransferase TrmL [Gammaproteobacteria bacterium]